MGVTKIPTDNEGCSVTVSRTLNKMGRKMSKQIYAKVRRLLSTLRPRRDGFFDAPELRPEDVMLVSYPRSGNTWVRVIIAYMLYDFERIKSLADINRLVPDIHRGIPRSNNYSNPRVIKTHRSFGFRHERHRLDLYSKNIYVVRHPIDVIRSYFSFQLKLWEVNETSLDRFAIKVTNGAIGPSWQSHVMSWKTMENELDILYVRYEDLVAEPLVEIQRIGSFLGRTLTERECEEINCKSSLENMRKLKKRIHW
jgi:hypothetical protein